MDWPAICPPPPALHHCHFVCALVFVIVIHLNSQGKMSHPQLLSGSSRSVTAKPKTLFFFLSVNQYYRLHTTLCHSRIKLKVKTGRKHLEPKEQKKKKKKTLRNSIWKIGSLKNDCGDSANSSLNSLCLFFALFTDQLFIFHLFGGIVKYTTQKMHPEPLSRPSSSS